MRATTLGAWAWTAGLDERHAFDPERADRALLFNAEHPNEDDPLRDYGVDDGHGWSDGENTWRFVASDLESTFVAVLEPYEDKRQISAIRRLGLGNGEAGGLLDTAVAVEIEH